jgi:hypothetical protein
MIEMLIGGVALLLATGIAAAIVPTSGRPGIIPGQAYRHSPSPLPGRTRAVPSRTERTPGFGWSTCTSLFSSIDRTTAWAGGST